MVRLMAHLRKGQGASGGNLRRNGKSSSSTEEAVRLRHRRLQRFALQAKV